VDFPWGPEAMLLIVLTALGVPPINPEVEDTILGGATLWLQLLASTLCLLSLFSDIYPLGKMVGMHSPSVSSSSV
jgi:hypothetical protein